MATAVEPVFSSIPTEQASVQTGTKRIRTVVVDDSETFLQVVWRCWNLIHEWMW